jgi:hypothetical protein
MSSVETDKLQRVRQTEPVINSYDSDEAPLSIAESSGQTLASITVSGSSLPDRDEDGSVTVDVSNFTTRRSLINGRARLGSNTGASWDRCGYLQTWWERRRLGAFRSGATRMDSYEPGRLGTLRERKRKHSQM